MLFLICSDRVPRSQQHHLNVQLQGGVQLAYCIGLPACGYILMTAGAFFTELGAQQKVERICRLLPGNDG